MPDQPSKHGRQHHADGPDPTVHSVAWPFKIFSDAQLVATGDGKLIFEIPFDLDEWSLVYVRIYVTTTGSGTTTVQIRNITQGHDLLSTKATIDSGETSSRTAATAHVVNAAGNAQVFDGDLLAFDVDGVGSGAKGLGATLWFDLIAV